MNILLDFLPFQHAFGIGGHNSFTKRVVDEILLKKDSESQVYALTDSSMPICKSFSVPDYCTQHRIILTDLAQMRIADIISTYNIDVLFISIGQLYAKYNLNGITCKTVMFIHDIFDIERCSNWLDLVIFDRFHDSPWGYAKRIVNLISGRWKRKAKNDYDNIMKLYMAENTIPCTVSRYTKDALNYYFPAISKDIKVWFSPIKDIAKMVNIENVRLAELIASKKPYMLLIAANRRYKNPRIVAETYSRVKDHFTDMHLMTLNYGETLDKTHIDIPYLSDSDLEHAYKNAAVLLFPSFFEGFGYPPLEAMKYGTPVVASNVTSIPEIAGNGSTLFSPFYPADFYRAIKHTLNNQEEMRRKALKCYKEMAQIQKAHLAQLTSEILTK